MIKNWVGSHKALIGSIASALVAVAPVVPPPYNVIPIAVATILGGVAGGQAAAQAICDAEFARQASLHGPPPMGKGYRPRLNELD